jgi:8-oxo-dGTP pyrophosphatase MutT (NUDIX family)
MKKDTIKKTYEDQRRVFVSYSRDDEEKPIVKNVLKKIAGFGVKSGKWKIIIDKKDLIAGDKFVQELQQFIQFSHVVIIIISEESLNKPFVNQEIGFTLANQIPFYPISVDGTKPSGMIMERHGQVISNENDIIEENIWNITSNDKKDFKWEKIESSFLGRFLTKAQKLSRRLKLTKPVIRFSGTIENLKYLFKDKYGFKDFCMDQKKLQFEMKLILYIPDKITIEQTSEFKKLLNQLSLIINDNAPNIIKVRIKSLNDTPLLKNSVLIFSNLMLMDLGRSPQISVTKYAPYISREVEKFENQFELIPCTDTLDIINDITQILRKRPDIFNAEIGIEQRFLSQESGLNNEIKQAKDLRLFVTTMNTFRIGLEYELSQKKQIRDIFSEIRSLKIYLYSYNVISKHPPGKPRNTIQQEWEQNLEFVIREFSAFKPLDFDIIILNTIPTFTGIYVANEENKVFKITNMISGVEPINIPQFVAWSDQYYKSSVIKNFEKLINDFNKDKHESALVFPISKRENNWQRESNLNIRAFIDQLKGMSNEFPCNLHDLFTVIVKSKIDISNVNDLMNTYFLQKDSGFYSLEKTGNKNWELCVSKDKLNKHNAISEKHVIAVFAMITNNGELLLIRKRKPNISWEFDVPGGKMLRSDSDLKSTLRREVFEEIGFTLDQNKLEQIFIKYDKMSEIEHNPCIPVYFHYKLDSKEIGFFDIIKKDTKGFDLIWITINELLGENVEKCHIPFGAIEKVVL